MSSGSGTDRTIEEIKIEHRSMKKQNSESTENMPPDYEEIKIEDRPLMKKSSKITPNLRLDYEDLNKERSMPKQSSLSIPKLPPDYELDDYWMQQVVLKDPKDEEDEFYSAYAHFSNYPLPEYAAKRAAAAPPYDWYKNHPFRDDVESVASQKKEKNENSVSYSNSLAENEKESNVKDPGFVNNKQSWKTAMKKRSNTHSRWFTNKTAASASATATPHHIKEDQNQLQTDHDQDRSRISLRHGPAANQEPNEE